MAIDEFQTKLLALIDCILTPKREEEVAKLLKTEQYLNLLAYRQLKIFIVNIILVSILIILEIMNLMQ